MNRTPLLADSPISPSVHVGGISIHFIVEFLNSACQLHRNFGDCTHLLLFYLFFSLLLPFLCTQESGCKGNQLWTISGPYHINPGNYIIHRFEDPPENLGLFCPCAQKFISQWNSFCSLWWVLEVNQQGNIQCYPKSDVCTVTELHLGKSFQIPEVLDSAPFYKSMMLMPLISTEAESRWGLFQIH